MFTQIEKFFTSYAGRVMISIVWGLGLAALFKQSCEGRGCQVIYQGPNPDEIQEGVYQYGQDNCYRYTPYISKCENTF